MHVAGIFAVIEGRGGSPEVVGYYRTEFEANETAKANGQQVEACWAVVLEDDTFYLIDGKPLPFKKNDKALEKLAVLSKLTAQERAVLGL